MTESPDTEHRVSLQGGPLDGWPIVVRGRLPETLRLPYSRKMLDLAGRPPEGSARKDWQAIQFPSESDADGVAVYHLSRGEHVPSPVYTFAGSTIAPTNNE